MSFFDTNTIAALIALKPISYFVRLSLAGLAFGAAMDAELTIKRVIGFVWLLLTGIGLLFVGITNGTIIDILLGLVALGGAGYSWWYTH